MMGYIASSGTLDITSLILGSILFAWQFPHFNALSYNLRNDYTKAGYRMLCVISPSKNALVALRYSLLMYPLSALTVLVNLTTPIFLFTSTIVNTYMAYYAVIFYKDQNRENARSLFFSSLIHLPFLLALLIFHKLRESNSIDEIVSDEIKL